MCTRSYLTTSTRPLCVAFDPDHKQKYTKMNFRRIDATWTFLYFEDGEVSKKAWKGTKSELSNGALLLLF